MLRWEVEGSMQGGLCELAECETPEGSVHLGGCLREHWEMRAAVKVGRDGQGLTHHPKIFGQEVSCP